MKKLLLIPFCLLLIVILFVLLPLPQQNKALFEAVKEGDVRQVEVLLKQGAAVPGDGTIAQSALTDTASGWEAPTEAGWNGKVGAVPQGANSGILPSGADTSLVSGADSSLNTAAPVSSAPAADATNAYAPGQAPPLSNPADALGVQSNINNAGQMQDIMKSMPNNLAAVKG